MTCHLDLRYGDMPGESIDLFPARKGDGSCLMFIHGGYWRSLDKNDFSFLAPTLVDAGISLAVVNYDLCPKVTVEEIVQQMLRASRWLWLHAEDYGMDQDRLYVGGHSAGGHLTAMLMCALWPVFDRACPRTCGRAASRSAASTTCGRIMQVDFLQVDLRLDEASAIAPFARLHAAGNALPGHDLRGRRRVERVPAPERACSASAGAAPSPATSRCPARNHFSVLDGLANQQSALFAGLRKLMKLDK